jgi:hypothetical protein
MPVSALVILAIFRYSGITASSVPRMYMRTPHKRIYAFTVVSNRHNPCHISYVWRHTRAPVWLIAIYEKPRTKSTEISGLTARQKPRMKLRPVYPVLSGMQSARHFLQMKIPGFSSVRNGAHFALSHIPVKHVTFSCAVSVGRLNCLFWRSSYAVSRLYHAGDWCTRTCMYWLASAAYTAGCSITCLYQRTRPAAFRALHALSIYYRPSITPLRVITTR